MDTRWFLYRFRWWTRQAEGRCCCIPWLEWSLLWQQSLSASICRYIGSLCCCFQMSSILQQKCTNGCFWSLEKAQWARISLKLPRWKDVVGFRFRTRSSPLSNTPSQIKSDRGILHTKRSLTDWQNSYTLPCSFPGCGKVDVLCECGVRLAVRRPLCCWFGWVHIPVSSIRTSVPSCTPISAEYTNTRTRKKIFCFAIWCSVGEQTYRISTGGTFHTRLFCLYLRFQQKGIMKYFECYPEKNSTSITATPRRCWTGVTFLRFL